MLNLSIAEAFPRRALRWGLLVLGAAATAAPALAAGPTPTEVLANVCAVCHGTGGKGAGRIPKLNGELKPQKFIDTMHGFVSGDERSTVMRHIAKGLSEAEIKALGQYFASLKQ